MIRLIDYHHLELLLRALINLLRLSYLLQQVLYNHTIVVPDIRRRNFKMVNRCYDIEFEFAVRGRLEDAGVDFDLFDTGAVEFFEGGDDAGFLASTGGPVDEEMGEIAALCL